jgi:ketosteroid isomerase-like protein
VKIFKGETGINRKAVVMKFNEFINRQDLEGLASLMADSYVFIDSSNTIIRGKEKALEAWREFFRLSPDYRNVFESVEIHDNLVVTTGHSSSSDKRLNGPALWTARVKDDRISEWRVYEDIPENRNSLGLLETNSLTKRSYDARRRVAL